MQVSVYQVFDSSKKNVSQGNKLLSSRLVPIHSSGWEVFTITQAVSVNEITLSESFSMTVLQTLGCIWDQMLPSERAE